MDPHLLLESLCRRHNVQLSRGERLLPLLEWALKCPERSRDRFLAFAERGLAEDARGHPLAESTLADATEHALMLAVARVMHAWTPDDGSRGLGLDL